MLYIYIGLILACEAAAFAALKQFSLQRQPWHFVAAVALYAVICVLLVKSFAFKDIGIINVLWSVFSIVAIISVGALAFHESLSWREAAGVGFAIIGVALLGGR